MSARVRRHARALRAVRLTPREREITAGIAAGHTNRRIAVQLGIRVATGRQSVRRMTASKRQRRRGAMKTPAASVHW